MESVTVWREAKVGNDSEFCKIRLGKFTDGYHATLFIRAIMNEAIENGLAGTLSISYDFTEEE